jgi:NitT/TauT family transport system permease protein
MARLQTSNLMLGFYRTALTLLGLLLLVVFWWSSLTVFGKGSLMALRFSPTQTFHAISNLWAQSDIVHHSFASLRRVGLGLLLALGIGVPIGLLVGSVRFFDHLTSSTFQLLRMISPLSWMPIAVMVLGVGEAPVVFLIAFAAIWPIILNVSAGIRAIDSSWIALADSLGSKTFEKLLYVKLPAIASHLLTGIRVAIGIIWVVLVPAEMLGVNAGLGYFILDTRDRMAYGELMATIVLIGLIGFVLDWIARTAYDIWSDQ